MSKLLTVKEVAERLRVHEMTVRRHIKSGRLRSTRVGRGVRVPEEAVDTIGRTQGRRQMTMEEIRAWVSRPRSAEERQELRRMGEERRRRREEAGPVGIPSDVLVRVARRGDEVSYGEKTWEELIAEESQPLDS